MFSGPDEAMNSNDPGKYSILGSIGNNMKYNGKYEFMIYFDEPNEYDWWRQSSFPLNEDDDSSIGKTVKGYENVSIKWTDNSWGGLAHSVLESYSCVPCLLDGTIGNSNYFYTIGNYACNNYYLSSTPKNTGGSKSVTLLMRVTDSFLHEIYRITCKISCKSSNLFVYFVSSLLGL